MTRTEVPEPLVGILIWSHVFTDGPQEKGGLHYCINSLSITLHSQSRNERKGLRLFNGLRLRHLEP